MSDAGTRDPLLEGLQLPDGTRLTKERKEFLTRVGKALLAGSRLYVYSYQNNSPHLTPRKIQGLSMRGSGLHAVARGLIKQGVITLGRDMSQPASYWREWEVVIQAPWDAIAKRLASQQTLDYRQREADDTAYRDAYTAYHDAQYACRKMLDDDPLPTTTQILQAFDALGKALQRKNVESAKLDAERARLAALPKPTPEEALTWLVSQQLKQKS